MEDPYIQSIMAWKPFRFIVGPEKKEFTMHSDLVASISEPMNDLVNGPSKEAREGVAHFPDIDEATFAYFMRFAYKGDYKGKALKKPTKPQRRECGCAFKQAQIQFSKNLTQGESNCLGVTLFEEFADDAELTFQMVTYRAIDENHIQTCSDRLFAHARVYVLAVTFDIPGLDMDAKKKIQQVLAILEINDVSIPKICELVRYVFINTVDEEDNLWYLLCHWCTMNLAVLQSNRAFKDLLRENGDFSAEIIHETLTNKSCNCLIYGL
ncbi:hypothetical protein E8E14_013830 [Neopestalotiopsis sp. 37M]|nr:hypothetical protein E8E14_013830 [Neopestalotiopsis sp. 37M]